MDEKTEAAYKRLLLWAVEHQEPHSRDILIVINEYISVKEKASVIIKGLAGAIPDVVQRQKAKGEAVALAALPPFLMRYQSMLQSNVGKKPVWFTKPLIEVCKGIRKGNAPATQQDMFETLLNSPEVWVDRDKDEYGDDVLNLTSEKKKPHKMTLEAFKKFEKKYRDQIGKKKKL